MDSMRSLNTGLPTSTTKRRRPYHPPTELTRAFKTAAYSVTQLYKAAAADEDAARAAGYQTAIDELLGFLDSENLGLGDGEGWRVRQWATERMTPDAYASSGEDEADEDEGERRARHKESGDDGAVLRYTTLASTSGEASSSSSSSTLQQTHPAPPSDASSTSTSSTSTRPDTSSHRPSDHHRDSPPRRTNTFTFSAPHTQPVDADMTGANTSSSTGFATPSLRLNVRPARRSPRKSRSADQRPGVVSADGMAALGLGLGHGHGGGVGGGGAGTKRKSVAQVDVFDFAGLGRDLNGGYGHGYGGGSGGGGVMGPGAAKRGRWAE